MERDLSKCREKCDGEQAEVAGALIHRQTLEICLTSSKLAALNTCWCDCLDPEASPCQDHEIGSSGLSLLCWIRVSSSCSLIAAWRLSSVHEAREVHGAPITPQLPQRLSMRNRFRFPQLGMSWCESFFIRIFSNTGILLCFTLWEVSQDIHIFFSSARDLSNSWHCRAENCS